MLAKSSPVKAGDTVMNPSRYCLPVPERPCVFTQSAHGEEEEWKACVTPATSLYNFRPHFPPRPLNLTAIWWFAAITIHSWVKINLWDASLGWGLKTYSNRMTRAWLWAGYDNLLWFILSADDSPHVARDYGRGIQYHSAKTQEWGKNRNLPHEEAQTRNSLFDGYRFQWCNDGVSLESFKAPPHLWFGVGWVHTWLAYCVLLHKMLKASHSFLA